MTTTPYPQLEDYQEPVDAPKQTNQKTLQFQISGRYITYLARCHWHENNPLAAFNTLHAAIPELTLEQTYNILEGRQTLQGWNEITLEPDNTPMPTSKDIKQQENKSAEETEKLYAQLSEFWDILDDHLGSDESEELRTYFNQPDKYWNQTKKISTLDYLFNNAKMQMQAAGLGELDELLEGQKELWEGTANLATKPDNTYPKPSGWLNPAGDYYPCTAYQHIALASELAPEQQNPEKYLEEQGWAKCSRKQWHTMKPLTKKQQDALFDWCLVHEPELTLEFNGRKQTYQDILDNDE